MINNSKKLLIISGSLDLKKGGSTKAVLELNRHLEKLFSVQLLVIGNAQRHTSQILTLPAILSNRFGVTLRLFQFKKVLEKPVTRVILHGHYMFSTLFSVLFSPQKVWIIPHGSLSNALSSKLGVHHSVFNFLLRFLFTRRDVTFIATSEIESMDISDHFPNTRVIVLPFGISILPELPAPKSLELHQEILVTCISRISRVKRLDLAVNAVKLLRDGGLDIRFTIAGDGDLRLLDELKALVYDNDLSKSVRFLPWADDDDKCEIFHGAHMFVLPSEHENFSYSAVEAISFGVPVILSRHVGIAPLVERLGLGSIASDLTADSVADAIRRTINDYPQIAQRLFQNRQVISWQSVSRQWKDALEN